MTSILFSRTRVKTDIQSNLSGSNIFGTMEIDMGSSNHWRLIIAAGQKANRDNPGIFFSIFYKIMVCYVNILFS